jgi:ribosome maturation factor RimP
LFVYKVEGDEFMAGLEPLLKATLGALGYHLADWELSNHGNMLRIFIEKPLEMYAVDSGITLADCEAASRQLQRAFEVEGIDYGRLEVSSPGLDRRLKTAADFERFAGREVDVSLRELVNGRRHIVGVVKQVEGDRVEIETEDLQVGFDIANVRRARLVPKV